MAPLVLFMGPFDAVYGAVAARLLGVAVMLCLVLLLNIVAAQLTRLVAGWQTDEGEDLEIELNEDEPAFLQGQTKNSLNLSPIKVVKNPDGSLQVPNWNGEFAGEARVWCGLAYVVWRNLGC